MVAVSSSAQTPGVRVTWQAVRHQPDAAARLLISEVAELLGCPEAEVRLGHHCQRCGSPDHGRPVVLTDLDERPPVVSLSRAAGVVVVALSRDRPVGIDIELAGAAGRPGPTEVLLHDRERAATAEERTTVWVRKESLLKATGDGLHVDPTLIRLTAPDRRPRILEWPGGEAPAAWMQDLDIDGYAACVTVLGDEPAEVSLRRAAPAAASR